MKVYLWFSLALVSSCLFVTNGQDAIEDDDFAEFEQFDAYDDQPDDFGNT